jgi:biopolymer transport protein ExbD/biopolymer transport protein TolR
MKPIVQRRAIYEPLAEINVTPFVDVMLVLLIVFMITAPMLAAGMRVDLPQAKSAQPLNPKEPVIITVRKDGKLYLGREELSPGQVADAVRARLGDDRERAIHLRGDREVAYGDIVAIVDQLAANGLLKVALLANARGEDRLSASKPPLGENRGGR